MKRCSRCQESKPLSAFGVARREKDGLRPECRDCRQVEAAQSAERNRARANKWYAENKDRAKAYNESHREQRRAWERAWTEEQKLQRQAKKKEWYEANEAEIIARNRDRFKADPERKYAYMREWHKAHPGYNAAHVKKWARKYPLRAKALQMNVSARTRGAPGEVTEDQWETILRFYDHACALCRSTRQLGVDHYRPLSKGGIHHWANVWPVCLRCNSEKYDHLLPSAPPHAIAFLLEAS